jgi:UDP-N-acetylmuramoyl-L-alanyl-D-glutamate--2,6-diaminopimelate ligase
MEVAGGMGTLGKGIPMLLTSLLSQLEPVTAASAPANLEIKGIAEDSRRVEPGDLFIARSGTKTDGQRYVTDAAARGAVAVLTESRLDDCPIPQIIVTSAARAASVLANAFRGHPSRSIKTFAITGTNGKTTTAYLIRHLLGKAKHKCGLIGTVEIDDGNNRCEAEMTTPSSIEVANLLRAMQDNGCSACAMETSSHALDQHRIAGVRFAGAGFTNLTGDHLDYHKTMDAYATAKARLFESLDEEAVAVVNADDAWSARMIENCEARIIKFGFGRTADYRATDVAITSEGSNFVLTTPDGKTEVKMQLIGRHNIENALTAAALVGETLGLSVHQIAAGLKDAQGAPGRLQSIRAGQPFAVLVDYAHTDDALQNVLSALRPLTRGKLRVIFGCGGNRDRTKRPRMARTAQQLADVVYVTSDNPREEQPQAILDEIVAGFSKNSGKTIVVEPDRRLMIERALADCGKGDVLLIAGKGHENYQIIGTTKHHFDDVEEATRAIQGHEANA